MKKGIKRIVFAMLLVVGIAACAQPVSVNAASGKAQKAVQAYNKYVKAKKYKKYTKTTKNISFMADESGKKKYNYMPDLNKDGVPELILLNAKKNTYYIFTYSKNKVKYVKKIAGKYKTDEPADLLYHKSKKQLWLAEVDMSKLIDLLSELMESDQTSIDENKLSQQLLEAMNIRIRESTYKVSKNGLKITKSKSTVVNIKATKTGIVIKLNGKERLRCTVSVNGKTMDKLDYSDENMKFDNVQIDFTVPGNKNKLSCVAKMGGYTAEQLAQMDSDQLEKIMKQEYYYGGKKISEKTANNKLNSMVKFMTSMKVFSESSKIGTLYAYPISKKGLVI